jgi:hypothetical protein
MPKVNALSAVVFLAVGLLLRAQDGQNQRTTALIRGTVSFQGTLPPAQRIGVYRGFFPSLPHGFEVERYI